MGRQQWIKCTTLDLPPSPLPHPPVPVQQRVPELVGREREPLEELPLGQRVEDVVDVPACAVVRVGGGADRGRESEGAAWQCYRIRRAAASAPHSSSIQRRLLLLRCHGRSLGTSTLPPRSLTHPTAAVRLRLPVERMMEEASACTTRAPSRCSSAISCSSSFCMRPCTSCSTGEARRQAGGRVVWLG